MSSILKESSPFENTQVAFSGKSDEELERAHFIFRSFNNPVLLTVGTFLTNTAIKLRFPVIGLIKETIYKQFCGGETLTECDLAIKNLAEGNIKTILQYCVETKSTEDEFDRIADELVKAAEFASHNENISAVSCKFTGIASFDLFEKIQAGESLDTAEKEALNRVRGRMHKMCEAAKKARVQLFFDAEETWIQQPMDDLVDEMMAHYNKENVIVYNTFQFYRTDRLDFLKVSHQKAQRGKYLLGAKLVRGAYMEKERDRAKQKGYFSPINPDKQSTDEAYNAALEYCVNNIRDIAFYAATHNEHSCELVINLLNRNNLKENHLHVFFSQLYGMGEHLTYNLANLGFNATKLVPYGPVREAIPYLIRRAQENSSVAGQVGRELQKISAEMNRRKLLK